MNLPLMILTAAGAIGAVDVLYFHLYRFRLFAQDGSVAEEVTHLCRHAIFLALVALLSGGTPSPAIDNVILGLFAVDMVNSIADVLLERRSRDRLGGLPSIEYLVHIVSTFAMGLAVASYILLRGTPLPAPVGLLAWQVHATLVAGVIIFLTEGALFAGVVMRRRRLASGPLPSGTPFPIARP
jgi:hypothetical protein